MTPIQCTVETQTDPIAPPHALPRKSGGGESSEVSALICLAQEISEKKQRLWKEMKGCLESGRNGAAIKIARQLCGLEESDGRSEEVSNGSPK